MISPDGSTVQVVGNVPGERDVVEQKLVPVPAIVDASRARAPGVSVHIISSTFLNRDFNELIASELDGSLRLTVPLTFLILLVAFGAIVAALIPLVLATTSLAAGYGLLGLYSQGVGPVSANAAQLLILMGLAVAVDYSLFMVTRFRSERQRGATVQEAIETSSSTAGRAVFFSGIAVVISLGGLLTLGISLFTSMAVGTMGVVLVSVIGSLTFLPATLAIVGDRVNLGRADHVDPAAPAARVGALAAIERRADRPPGQRLLGEPRERGHVSSGDPHRPLGRPAARGRVACAATSHGHDGDHRAALDHRRHRRHQADQREVPVHGQDIRLDVVVTNPNEPTVAAAIQTLISRVDALEGIGEGKLVRTAQDGHAALISFPMTGNRNDEANRALVREVRSDVVPSLFRGVGKPFPAFGDFAESDVYVSGQTARTMDIVGIYSAATPRIFGFVLGLSFLLMLVAFRSIVIPIKAILLQPALNRGRVRRAGPRVPRGLVRGCRSGSRRAGSSRAGSRSSSSRSCSGCRWTTTCSSSPGSRRRGTEGWTRGRPWRAASR